MPLTQEQQEAVRMGTPIEWNGLTLFPILMKDYNRFIIAQMGLTAQQQTLPSKYVVMRYLEALYALDYDVRTNGGPQGGFFSRILLFLMLSLRLEVRKGLDGEEYIPIGNQTEKDNQRKLTVLEVTQGEVTVEITPQNFVTLREIMDEKKDKEQQDETTNAEMVKEKRE